MAVTFNLNHLKARLLFFLIIFLGLFTSKMAKAASYTWTGNAGNNSWTTAGNWNNSGYPGLFSTIDDVTIGKNVNISLPFSVEVRNISISDGFTVTITLQNATLTSSGSINIGNGSATTLNFAGTGAVAGTSAISLRSLSKITTSANVPLTAATLTTVYANSVTINATATFNGKVTLNGLMTISQPGTTTLTTNAAGNAFNGGFKIDYNGSNIGNLTWLGSNTSTCSIAASTVNAYCKLTIGSMTSTGGTVTFNGDLALNNDASVSGAIAQLINYANINFNGTAVTSTPASSSNTINSITNNSTGNITLSASTSSKINIGNYCLFSNSGDVIANSGSSINLNNSSGFACNSGSTVTMSGTSAANASSINLNGASSNLTNNGGTLTFNDYASLNLSSNPCTATNNSGTFNFNANAALNLKNPNTTFNNYSVVNLNTSGITLSGQSSSISNLSSGVFDINASTVILNANSSSISNAGNFKVYGNSFITTLNPPPPILPDNTPRDQTISNSGTFYAGLPNSPCTITLGGTADKINDTGGTFYLGSTSTILPNNVATIKNTSPAKFILQSDANGSAAIAQIANTSTSFVGIFDVERFFTGGNLIANRGYRLMSSPVHLTTQATSNTSAYNLSFIKNSAFTGGPGGPGSGFSGSSIGPTVYLYKETLPASNTTFTSGKHVGILSIDASTGNMTLSDNSVPALASIPIGNGYLFFFVGSRFLNGGGPRTSGSANATPVSGPPTDATTTTSGYLNQGGFTANLWWNSTGKLSNAATSAPGFNMMGNPYPCTLDLGKVLTQNNTSVDAAYVLSSKTGGTNQNYVAYTDNSLSSSPIGQPNIVSGGGFIVHVKSGALNPVLTFAESQKVSTNLSGPTGSSLIMSTPMTGLLHPASSNLNKKMATSISATLPAVTGLYMKLEQDSTIYDYCGIYFDKDASAKFADRDALNLNATTSRAYMASLSSDGIKTSINSMPDYHASSHIKLYVAASANGRYQLKLEGVRNIDTLYDIFLIDKYKRDSLDIRQYGAYKFDLITSDTTTYGGNRFELSIRRRPLPACQLVAFTGTKNTNNSINIRWKVYNEGNYTGFTLEKQDGGTINYTTLYNKQSDGSSVYTFVDNNPHLGLNIYRLKQNDIDSRIGYSNAVTVDMNSTGKEDNMFSVYPNPTTERINININLLTSPLASSNTYQFNIYNNSGSLIMKRTLASTNLSENVAGLLPGTYIVEVRQANGNLLGKTKFVKVN